jgi:hypothetical protein
MGYNFVGFVRAAKEFPAFCIPIFKHGTDKNLYSQNVGNEGLIESFCAVSEEEYEHLLTDQNPTFEKSLEVGSVACYSFFLSQSEGIFDDRIAVENYVESNMEVISASAVMNLLALRFIGCSRVQELTAIDELAQVFENPDVRERFRAIEYSMLRTTEAQEQIELLIDALSSSRNFSSTHEIISSLQRLRADFEQRHFKMAMRACLNNSQVYWVSGDDDVRKFTRFLIDVGNLKLTEDAMSKLEA